MVIISACLIRYHVSLLRPLSTIFLFWHFTEHFERLVCESSGGEETPSHPVCHPLPLSAVLSACWPPRSPVCQTVSPPASNPTPPHITAKTINSAAVHSLVLHPPPISAGGAGYRFLHMLMNGLLFSHVTPFSVGLREVWFQIEGRQMKAQIISNAELNICQLPCLN